MVCQECTAHHILQHYFATISKVYDGGTKADVMFYDLKRDAVEAAQVAITENPGADLGAD